MTRFRMSRVVQHEWEEAGMHLRYLCAKHPKIGGGNVHHVQVVPSRVIPSRRQAAPDPYIKTRPSTNPFKNGTQEAPSMLLCGI